jgi:hypothetical protein
MPCDGTIQNTATKLSSAGTVLEKTKSKKRHGLKKNLMRSRDIHQNQDFGAKLFSVDHLHARVKCGIFISPIRKVVPVLKTN